MPTLAELFAAMGPGNVQGMPQMAPPVGIPWETPQQPAPPPAAPAKNRNAGQAQQQTTRKVTPANPENNYSTPEAVGDAASGFMTWLDSMAEANMARDKPASPAKGSRGAAEDQSEAYRQQQPHTLKPPGGYGSAPTFGENAPQVSTPPQATPARGNAETQGYQPELTTFDVYGAPVPSRRPLDLGQLFYGGETPPMPERAPGQPTSAPIPARKSAQSAAPATASGVPPTPQQANRGGGVGAPSSTQPARAPIPRTPGAPNTDDPFPQSSPLFDPLTAKFLLQTGLSLMVPKWGNPLSQIGQAVGSGAEAVQRSQKQDQDTEMGAKKLALEQQKADKMGLGRRGRASESSGSKRLKQRTPAQRFTEDLSPEAGLYFNQRVKDLNKVGEDESITPEQKYAQLLKETQNVDLRARERRGMVRSAEINDAQINAVAGNPALETQMLNAVSADPTQKALMMQRIEQAKQAKVKPNGGAAAQ